MTLLETQIEFARLVPRLIDFCFAKHYEVVLGEAYRPPETVKIYAADGRGSASSLHPDKLAIDIILFINGNRLIQTESYEEAGEYWKSLSTPEITLCWGGDFKSRPDGGHFSALWSGRR